MKRLLFPILLLSPFLLFSQNYVIKGQIGKLNAPARIFLAYTVNGVNKVDSSGFKDGLFKFAGNVKDIGQGVLVLDYKGEGLNTFNNKANPDVLSVYLTKGTTVITSSDSLSKAKVRGTKVNTDNQQYQALLKPAINKLRGINRQYTAAAPEKRSSKPFIDDLQTQYNLAQETLKQLIKQYISGHRSSYISLAALVNMAGDNFDPSEVEPLYRSLSPDLKGSALGKQFTALLAVVKRTSIGALAADFMQNDVNGKPVRLSDFRGKYVLIDFWASWCGPCRQENPNLVATYNRFKDKNFTVLGVSLDRPGARESWIKAIKDDGLAWTQVSDLKFWNNDAAVMYGVQAIPQNFLVDPQGKIIAKNLRGRDLETKLQQVIKPL